MKLGMLGLSEGNGHPYSFSAIINGYNEARMAEAGWPVIHAYLKRRDPTDFGVDGLEVTHVWCPEQSDAQTIARATNIEQVCTAPEDMLEHVDAVIIARDDWRSHLPLASPFLDAGIPVLLDKPLTLDPAELAYFAPFLATGQLMSCSALRYAKELDDYRVFCQQQPLTHINATVVLGWETYGIHMIDAIFSGIPFDPVSVISMQNQRSHVRTTHIECEAGTSISISCLGPGPKCFNINAYNSIDRMHFEIEDNFSAFQRLLKHFSHMLQNKRPAIPSDFTLGCMELMMAANESLTLGKAIKLND